MAKRNEKLFLVDFTAILNENGDKFMGSEEVYAKDRAQAIAKVSRTVRNEYGAEGVVADHVEEG